ncbi:ADP-ribose pyrophosphatase, partial [Candidatus Atribacteria bacterium HGW-Atribacteria-1]
MNKEDSLEKKILSSTYIYKGKTIKLRQDKVKL